MTSPSDPVADPGSTTIDSRLDRLYNPQSVTLVGASTNELSIGGQVYRNLQLDFPGRRYPVNARSPEVLGDKAYASIDDLPEPVDLVIVMRPRGERPRCGAQLHRPRRRRGVHHLRGVQRGRRRGPRPARGDRRAGPRAQLPRDGPELHRVLERSQEGGRHLRAVRLARAADRRSRRHRLPERRLRRPSSSTAP